MEFQSLCLKNKKFYRNKLKIIFLVTIIANKILDELHGVIIIKPYNNIQHVFYL